MKEAWSPRSGAESGPRIRVLWRGPADGSLRRGELWSARRPDREAKKTANLGIQPTVALVASGFYK
jgi:hypothetical protein